MQCCSRSSATLTCAGVVGGMRMFKSHWDFHTAGSGCVPLSPTLIIFLFYPSIRLRRRNKWLNRIISGGEQPSRSAQVGNLLFLCMFQFHISLAKLGAEQCEAASAFWVLEQVFSLCSQVALKQNHCLSLTMFWFLKDWILHPGFQKPSSQCSVFAALVHIEAVAKCQCGSQCSVTAAVLTLSHAEGFGPYRKLFSNSSTYTFLLEILCRFLFPFTWSFTNESPTRIGLCLWIF